MVLHRLIQVLRLGDGGVEAGQQLAGDDQDLQRVVRVSVAVEELLLGVFVPDVDLPLGRILLGRAHDDRGGVRPQQLVHLGLVEKAALAIEDDDLGLEAIRLNLLPEVLNHMLDDGLHALGVLHQGCHLGRLLA